MSRFTVFLALIATFGLATGVQAQQADDEEVRQELRSLVAEGDDARADRTIVAEFLERDDVRQVAADRGIELQRLDDAVQALGAGEVATLAEHIQDAEPELAGGNTIVITTTTVIIILLILLLI